MPPGSFVDLHEFDLDVGSYSIILESTSDTVDWGMTLHPYEIPFLSKSLSVPDGIAWQNPAGVAESIMVEITTAGEYCLSVWKKGTTDLLKDGSYRLTITLGCCDLAGDFDNNGTVDISDLTATVDYMFRGGPPAICGDKADVDGNCAIDISDLTYRVDFMFRGGAALQCGCVGL